MDNIFEIIQWGYNLLMPIIAFFVGRKRSLQREAKEAASDYNQIVDGFIEESQNLYSKWVEERKEKMDLMDENEVLRQQISQLKSNNDGS